MGEAVPTTELFQLARGARGQFGEESFGQSTKQLRQTALASDHPIWRHVDDLRHRAGLG
jgi:hypothetical protein